MLCRAFLVNNDFDASVKMPLKLPLKMSLPENVKTVNLKGASFMVIMLLHKGFTHKQSQKKPRLHFGESFALFADNYHIFNHSTCQL